jgi:hypothetical protein
LVNNALIAGLDFSEHTPTLVNRSVFEFLNSHMPISGDINSLNEKIRLVEAGLWTLVRKDFTSLRKFFTWLTVHLDKEQEQAKMNDPAVTALVPALKNIFDKFN